MNPSMKYPFSLNNAFFIAIDIKRVNVLPEPMEVSIEAQVRVIDNFPNIQINLRSKTPDESPVKFTLELVGLFDYVGDAPEEDRAVVADFVKEKGLHMLWPYFSQMIRMITGQMGMNPLNIKTPIHFDVPSGALIPAKEE
jgi:preprotein translocase subunit SecB